MNTFFQNHRQSMVLGFMAGVMIFFLSAFGGQIESPENLGAAITIPFANTDAGLEVELGENASKIVSQTNEDAGATLVVNILSKIFLILKATLGTIVVFWIIWSGVYIIAGANDEERVKTGKQMLKYSVFGLAAMLLVEPLVLDIFYGGGEIHTDTTGIGDIQKSTDNFRAEVSGVLDFVKTLLIFIAMGYIIKAGSQMIFAYGDEEKISSAKGIFFPMFLGFLLIMFNEVFIDEVLYKAVLKGDAVEFTLGDASGVSQFVIEIVAFLKYVLGFVALILFGFIVYGGFVVMTSMGDDEKLDSGKKILFNAIIGMIIILSSLVLMLSLVNFEV